VAKFSIKHNRLPCLAGMQNFQNDRMVGHVSLETLQGTSGVCAKKLTSLSLLLNENKGSADDIMFGHTTIKVVHTV
jgi:hypothetical protein